MRSLSAVWLVVLLVCAGCSALVDPDTRDLGSPPPLPCQPGAVIQCACLGGFTGTQTCTPQERYDACDCNSPAGTAGAGGS